MNRWTQPLETETHPVLSVGPLRPSLDGAAGSLRGRTAATAATVTGREGTRRDETGVHAVLHGDQDSMKQRQGSEAMRPE